MKFESTTSGAKSTHYSIRSVSKKHRSSSKYRVNSQTFYGFCNTRISIKADRLVEIMYEMKKYYVFSYVPGNLRIVYICPIFLIYNVVGTQWIVFSKLLSTWSIKFFEQLSCCCINAILVYPKNSSSSSYLNSMRFLVENSKWPKHCVRFF